MPGSRFCWYELMTTDAPAAEAFYRAVIGWESQAAGGAAMPYTLLTAGGVPLAGLMTLPKHMLDAGARPGWTGYIGVADVDAMAARVREKGGAVHRAPDDIPGVGRFGVVADPQGAVFVLFSGAPGNAPPPEADDKPGYPGWRELAAANGEQAFAFYADLFGWAKDQSVDMGPMGIYQLFALDGAAMGGMMTKPESLPSPLWIYYFMVDSIAAAAERIRAAGGSVVNGPHQVPGGKWIVQGLDPQGALFALLSTGITA